MRWHPFFWLSVTAVVFSSVVFTSSGKAQQPPATPPAAQPAAAVSNDVCLKCHKPIAKAYKDGFHAGLQCMQCHPKGATHVEDIDTPADTDYRWEACGSCHKYQYETMKMDDPVKIGPFGGTPADPKANPKTNDFPLLNKLIAGHGFTIEYNEDRSHKYLLKDHIDIKRKQNSACLNCKSTAVAYNWNSDWKGIKLTPTADWKEVIARIPKETLDYGMACSHCHDPHAPRLRIIRKAMIEAIEKRGVNPYWPEKNAKSFEEADAQQQQTLVCAQCHVEYTCGPGSDKVVRDHFPWRKMRDLHDHYAKEFNYQQDWKHALTGESLIKSQHPETETFWESKYERAGASCPSCHMPKLTWGGKTFTSHWMTSPYKYLDRYIKGDKQYGAYPCAQCHPTVPAEKLMAQAQRVQKHVFEVQKNAQEALSDCIDAIAAAKKAAEGEGAVDAAKLAEAVKHHQLAHVRWENLVVSENSMGFHNPEEVLMELGKAIDFARKAQLLALQAVKPHPPAAAKTATKTATKPTAPPKPKASGTR